MKKEKSIEVKKKEIDTLFYFVKQTEDPKHKAGLYAAFCRGLKRKLKGGDTNAKTTL